MHSEGVRGHFRFCRWFDAKFLVDAVPGFLIVRIWDVKETRWCEECSHSYHYEGNDQCKPWHTQCLPRAGPDNPEDEDKAEKKQHDNPCEAFILYVLLQVSFTTLLQTPRAGTIEVGLTGVRFDRGFYKARSWSEPWNMVHGISAGVVDTYLRLCVVTVPASAPRYVTTAVKL